MELVTPQKLYNSKYNDLQDGKIHFSNIKLILLIMDMTHPKSFLLQWAAGGWARSPPNILLSPA